MKEIIFNLLKEIETWIGLILPIITFISLVTPQIRKFLKKKIKSLVGFDEVKNDISKMHDEITSMQEQIDKIDETLQQHIEKDSEKMEAQMFNLKDSLMRSFHFYNDRGYITLEELDTLQDVYKSYRKFGGNGLFKAIWENQILKLPNKPPNE